MGTEVHKSIREAVIGGLPAPRSSVDGGLPMFADQGLVDAYLRAEMRTPNTLITIGPFVMNTFLQNLQSGRDIRAAVQGLVIARFTPEQMENGLRESNIAHRDRDVPVRGVPAESERSDRMVSRGITVFTPDLLLTVYREGVNNGLNAIAVLNDADVDITQGNRTEGTIAFLERPGNLERTQVMFQAVVDALDEATDITDAYQESITPSHGGHAPSAKEKQKLQATLIERMSGSVIPLATRLRFSESQARRFMEVLTNPELSKKAA